MNTRNLIMFSAIFGLSALAAQVYAEPQGGMPFPFDFANEKNTSIDTNGDGRISAAELTANRTAEFTAINTETTTDISFAEFSAYLTNQQTAKLTGLDTDNNGTLSVEEFIADKTDSNTVSLITEIFDLADSDNNDALSAAEFNVLLPNAGGAILHFTMLDQNRDLLISQEEYLAAPRTKKTGGFPQPSGHGRH